MKTKYLLPILLTLCFHANAQDVSGLYSGTLVNDSTRKVQNYELALSEYKGKITGYAYTTFVVNDTFYYSVKRVKATKDNGNLIVEDIKMLANNFPTEASKGVHQINTIPLPLQDSISMLKGTWQTNQTKVYYAIHGGLDLRKDNDSSRSALISHLYELDVLQRPAPIYVNNTRKGPEQTKTAKESAEREERKAATAKSKIDVPAAIPAENRTTKLLQTIDVTSDSLVLSFYDNGIVDGDTISVSFNGQNIIAKTRLTAVAAKRSVLLQTADIDTYQLTLVAENLGSIPPNTGLLVVQDGTNKYYIHFSADLQNNAAVVFRKKK